MIMRYLAGVVHFGKKNTAESSKIFYAAVFCMVVLDTIDNAYQVTVLRQPLFRRFMQMHEDNEDN